MLSVKSLNFNQIHNLKDNDHETFPENSLIIAHFKSIIFCGQILERDRRQSRVITGKKNCRFSRRIRGKFSKFALEG